jgi:autotransporter-associated beta strand protein
VDLSVAVTIGSGVWRKDGAGTLSIINSDSSAAGAININEGTFEIGGNGQIRSTTQAGGSGIISNAINNEGIFKHNTTQNQTISGVISGTGAVEKDNTGILTLSGANTFTGNVLVSNGTLTTGINTRKSFGANSAGRTVTVDGATSVLDR